ncbi:MAG: 4-alpha-glucanotransferase [Pedobacter sp.]|nr:MAG: 4-alpha-glucanotransferase [Pedobacter sp.]
MSQGQLYSPYSATSVMAGNVLFISPEVLQSDGLLDINDLKVYMRKTKRNISYEKAFKLKSELLSKAYHTYLSTGTSKNASALSDFCQQEAYWLDDYVLYTLLQRLNEGKAWHQWSDELKNRDQQAIANVLQDYSAELDELRWQQYIFFQQWKRLRAYASSLGISIIGDLPFYASMDSSDVWTHRSLFSVNNIGQIDGVAGVPPDYFNEDGQLWGMPVYKWDAMQKNDFQWWIQRIAKNAELYDTIRLDHFRAFSSYWEIPAGSDSAKSGSWKPGPGVAFFKALLNKVTNVKLIAEDLGEISEDVFQLRDQFTMPGMKVLQFAFADDNPISIHAPHNYENTNCIVYTGTHDNNTTRGWYKDEANSLVKSTLEEYIGRRINEKSISIEMIRLALKSTAQIAIIPMQDILNKSTKSRMNTPASTTGNWKWRLKPEELKPGKTIKKIRKYIEIYGR